MNIRFTRRHIEVLIRRRTYYTVLAAVWIDVSNEKYILVLRAVPRV